MELWSAFVGGLEDLIRRFGLARMVVAIGGFAGAVLGLGVVVSQAVIAIGAGTLLTCVLFLTVLALGLDRRRLYGQVADLSTILDRYGDELVQRQHEKSFRIKDWVEEITVSKKGDAVITRWFTLQVGPEPLEFFWHRCYRTEHPGSATQQSTVGYQSRVDVVARSFEVTEQGPVPGTRFPVTTDWEGHSLRTFVHFYEAQEPESHVLVRLRIKWPRYYEELLDGDAVEPFEWTFRRKTDHLKVTITFKEGIGLREVFRTHRIGNQGLPKQDRDRDGTVRVVYECHSPPQNEKLGFRLERR
ncbi:MAG TPA: hypothetical protein VFR97_10315 [Capillimicrobium sp.]|nr:hypothetical protein [Capillimicrobium sp.]